MKVMIEVDLLDHFQVRELIGWLKKQLGEEDTPTQPGQINYVVWHGYYGDSKIKVIKAVRLAFNCGLKEAKRIVEGDLPNPINLQTIANGGPLTFPVKVWVGHDRADIVCHNASQLTGVFNAEFGIDVEFYENKPISF